MPRPALRPQWSGHLPHGLVRAALLLMPVALFAGADTRPGLYEPGYTHPAIVARAVTALEAYDLNGYYREIYGEAFGIGRPAGEVTPGPPRKLEEPMGALLLGASQEDRCTREWRHYYQPGAAAGLAWQWYFPLVQQLVGCGPLSQAASFLNALQFALDDPNSLNWPGAIQEYDYTETAKKEAYYRLGHVAHLLADMAQPDHVTRTFHPPPLWTSQFVTDHVQQIVDAGVAQLSPSVVDICATLSDDDPFGIGYKCSSKAAGWCPAPPPVNTVPCMPCAVTDPTPCDNADILAAFKDYVTSRLLQQVGSNRVGYERLINEGWPASGQWPYLPQPDKRTSFQAYLDAAAGRWAELQGQVNVAPPLGFTYFCFDVPPSVTSTPPADKPCLPIVPTLALGGPATLGQMATYTALADSLIPKATGLVAGLLQWYYEIVNRPPFVWKIQVLQRGEIAYSREWCDLYEEHGYTRLHRHVDSRSLANPAAYVEAPDMSLREGVPATIRIWLTPLGEPPLAVDMLEGGLAWPTGEPASKQPGTVVVTVGDQTVEGGFVDISRSRSAPRDLWGSLCPIPGAPDTARFQPFPPQERVWQGTFTPELGAVCQVTRRTIAIAAEDAYPHWAERNHPGHVLDSDPSTPARAGPAPPYHWTAYEPGPDTVHKIYIAPRFTLAAAPPSRFVLEPLLPASYTVTLSVPGGSEYAPGIAEAGPADPPHDVELLATPPAGVQATVAPPVVTVPPRTTGPGNPAPTATLSVSASSGTHQVQVMGVKGFVAIGFPGPLGEPGKPTPFGCADTVSVSVASPRKPWEVDLDLEWDPIPPIPEPLPPIREGEPWPPFEATLRNRGKDPVPPGFLIEIRLDGRKVHEFRAAELQPGETFRVKYQLPGAATRGEHRVEFIADGEGKLGERNRRNNAVLGVIRVERRR